MKYLVFSCLILSVWANSCQNLLLLPAPRSCEAKPQATPVNIADPCAILYKFEGVPEKNRGHFNELVNHYQKKNFNCSSGNLHHITPVQTSTHEQGFQYHVTIKAKDSDLKSVFTAEQESYELKANEKETVIQTETYVGVVRAMQTFSQLFTCERFRRTGTRKGCNLTSLPITINDKPTFTYRGVMIDTARHYLPFHMILETIDALMYNKMNVLHWHITDEDSFPLSLEKHPELAEYAAFSPEEKYTTAQAREVVRYAMVRGVRVVPEIDSPGHAASWARAPQNKGVACTGRYMGALDVTLQATYKLVEDIFSEIIDIFPDPVIHMGGDEVSLGCMANKTELIRLEKDKVGNGSPRELELYYRKRQHEIIMKLNPQKKPIYWINSGQAKIESNDMIHWWGGINLPKFNNPVVLSFYGQYYLDLGVGNFLGSAYGMYYTWMDYYNNNPAKLVQNSGSKDNVAGAVACLWSEMSNRYTHHQKIWIRTSSLADKLWFDNGEPAKPGGLKRVAAHERRMNRRGIPTAPATCQQCETSPQFC